MPAVHTRALAALTVAALLASSVPAALADSPSTHRRRTKQRAGVRRATVRRPAPVRVAGTVLVSAQGGSLRDGTIGEAMRRGMQGVAGAAVAMDPQTGRVIAVVNPALGVDAAFQPCSVFKIVVAIAGLTEGVITPESVHECNGGCWFWPGHGKIDLRRAIADSCNPYFQWVGGLLGYTKIEHYARLLGLGSPTGINLPNESPGALPAWMPPAAVPHMSSHADRVTTTAVQLAAMLSAIVNGGVLYQPQLAAAQGFVPRERWRLPANLPLGSLYDGFLAAVNEGSATQAFDPDIVVAGKTGTCAGVGWFASYAPADHPEVVLVVFTRPGNGHRSSEVAGRIYQAMYKGENAVAPAPPPAPVDATEQP
jgi:penicillin-binding protein 2